MDTGLTGWLEIFKSGTHTDSAGIERTFTEADLDIILNNSWSSLPIPHVITHQELYSPFAYAQAVELRRDGDVILARTANIEPQFEKLVKEGRLYNRSVRMIPAENGWKITHIAWLGAEPPAVEGLAPVQFSTSGNAIDFSLSTIRKPEGSVVSDKGSGGAGFTQADLDAAKEAAKREAVAEFSREKAKLEAELKVERDNQRKVIWKGRIDAAIREGRLTPAQAEGMVEFALGLPGESIEFSRGSDKPETVKTTGEQWFIDFMSRLPKQVAMAKDIGGDADAVMDTDDADAIARAAIEYQAAMQAKGVVISASTAVAHVTKGGKA